MVAIGAVRYDLEARWPIWRLRKGRGGRISVCQAVIGGQSRQAIERRTVPARRDGLEAIRAEVLGEHVRLTLSRGSTIAESSSECVRCCVAGNRKPIVVQGSRGQI